MEMSTESEIPFYQKGLICLLAVLVGAFPLAKLNPELLPDYLPKGVFVIAALVLSMSLLIFLIVWHRIDRKGRTKGQKAFYFINDVIAICLGFGFVKWALLKFLHLHMTTSLAWMEMPMSMLAGYQQLSHFYGQNYPLVVTLGIVELTGALLVLSERTRLFGALVLVVACSNILMLDIFFGIYSPISEAAILLMASLYFVFLERKKIIQLIFNKRIEPSWSSSRLVLNGLKFSAILIPCLIFIPNYKVQYRPNVTGKYEIVNRVKANSITEIDLKYDYIYFDLGNYFAFVSKDWTELRVGQFCIDNESRKFVVTWKDASQMTGQLSMPDEKGLAKLVGMFNGKDFEFDLIKRKVKSICRTY